ncbi:hypothetical protein MMU05_01510 [Aquiflexum sp. AIY15W]|nr:hypothetical protein [Cognataquiflexum rubidum]
MKLNSCFKIIFEKTVYVLYSKNAWFTFMLLPYFLFSCENPKTNTTIQEKEILYSGIAVDTVYLVKDDFSGIGFFQFSQGELYFVDQIFSTVSKYNASGELIGTFLGKGDGPSEQNNIQGFVPKALEEGHVVLDNFELVIFDSNFVRQKRLPIAWNHSDSYQEMLDNPKAEMLGLYEIAWKMKGENSAFLPVGKDAQRSILLPISMSHPTLNGYISEEYYKNVYTFGRYDLSLNKIETGFGNRSEEYLRHGFIPNFDFFHFTTKGDSILVSFGIDPLIHVYNQDFKLIGKFGWPGEEMNVNYPKTQTIEEAIDNYKTDLEKAGFYHHIYFDSASQLLFRTYFPDGLEKGKSRLQVFKNHILVGDFEVPERFRVLGSEGSTFIADGILDEEKDKLGIFKFSLK